MVPASLFRLRLKLFAVLVLGFVLPATAAGFLARDWVKEAMTLAFMEKAYLLERQVKANVELAVSLGIPMKNRRVIDSTFQYFVRLLTSHHEVRFIAVTDENLNLIVFEGTNKRRLRGILKNDNVREAMAQFRLGSSADQLAQAGTFSIAVSPLKVGPGPPGWLLVAADSRRTGRFLAASLPALVAAVIFVILVFWQVASFALDFFYGDRLRELRRVFEATSQDRVCALDSPRRYDEPGYLAQRHNAVVHHLQDRYQQLAVYASEVRQAIYDKAVADRVRLLAEEAGARLGHLESPSCLNPGLGVETRLRLPLFLLSFAAALVGLCLAKASPWGTVVSLTLPTQGILVAVLWALVPPIAHAFAGLLPLRSARRLLYAASASLFAAIAVLGGVGAGGLGLLVLSGCVVTALALSALAAIAAFRALGAGPRAPLLWLMLIFCSGGAAAACLEVGLGAQLDLEARLVVIGLLTGSASLLTLLLEKTPAPAAGA